MKQLTTNQVFHIAHLARLTITDAEAEKYKNQLGQILQYVEKLGTLHTGGIRETNQVTGLKNITRSDEASESRITSKNEHFTVPAVLE